MPNYIVAGTDLTSVANAIRTKGGTSSPLNFPTGFVSAVDAIPTGGGSSVDPSDVNFIDYDGTILHAYTAAEFANLSAMPANPTHSGLTAQGWNWTLADAKTYVADCGMLDIGQMYVTDDGKTRLYITIAAEGRYSLKVAFTQTVANGVTIDWGDGSATETSSYTGATTLTHTYSTAGSYVITLYPAEGCSMNLGTSSLRVISGEQSVYKTMLKKVEVGVRTALYTRAFWELAQLSIITLPNGIPHIGEYTFSLCRSLYSITIPSGATQIGQYAFQNCTGLYRVSIPKSNNSVQQYAFTGCASLQRIAIPGTGIHTNAFSNCLTLSRITMPNNTPSIADYAFSSCPSLSGFTIPSNVKTIGRSAFSSCTALVNLTIPSNVTSISQGAFSYCSSLKEIHVLPTTPPTLSNSDAFASLPTDCIIFVPASSLTAYQTATNWSTYSSKMVGEGAVGYDLTLIAQGRNYWGAFEDYEVYVKFDAAPSSASDYDVQIIPPTAGGQAYCYDKDGNELSGNSGTTSGVYCNETFNGISSAYVWIENATINTQCDYKVDAGSANTMGLGYANATQITLSANATLTIDCDYDE